MSAFSGPQFQGARRVHKQALRDDAAARQARFAAMTDVERLRAWQAREVYPAKELAKMIVSIPGVLAHMQAGGWS